MKKMLVVDDEDQITDFLKCFFEERDFQVKTAASGSAAIQLVSYFAPDIVLLDVMMPKMDGLEALKEIKQITPKTKVIMVTAIETKEKIEEAIRLGADNYITKPLSLEYLEK